MRPGSPRSLVVLTVAGLAGVLGSVVLVLSSDHETDKAFQVVAGAVVAPSFVGTGLFAWWRRPHNRAGLLMYGLGYLLKHRVSDLGRFLDAVDRVASGAPALDPEVVSHLRGRHRTGDPLGPNHAIAEQLVITERAVEKHVTRIFPKLDLPPAAEAHRRVLAVLKYLQAPAAAR